MKEFKEVFNEEACEQVGEQVEPKRKQGRPFSDAEKIPLAEKAWSNHEPCIDYFERVAWRARMNFKEKGNEFIILTDFPYHTQGGNFYEHIYEGIWRRVHFYLKPATEKKQLQQAKEMFAKLKSDSQVERLPGARTLCGENYCRFQFVKETNVLRMLPHYPERLRIVEE